MFGCSPVFAVLYVSAHPHPHALQLAMMMHSTNAHTYMCAAFLPFIFKFK